MLKLEEDEHVNFLVQDTCCEKKEKAKVGLKGTANGKTKLGSFCKDQSPKQKLKNKKPGRKFTNHFVIFLF